MRCDVLANNWTIVARDKKNGNCIRTRGSNRYATRISLSGPQVGKNKEEECPIIINMGISDQPADCRNFARITAGDVEYFIFDATKKPQHADWTTTFKWIDNGQKSKFAWAQTWVLMDMLNKQPPQGARGDDNPNKNLVVDSVYNGGNVSLNNHQLRSYRMNIEGEINVRHQLQKIIPETVVFDKLTLMEPSRDVFVNIVPSDLGNSSQQTKVWAIRESSFNKMLMHLQQLKMEQVQRTKAQTNGARATEIQDLLVSEEPPQKKMRQN